MRVSTSIARSTRHTVTISSELHCGPPGSSSLGTMTVTFSRRGLMTRPTMTASNSNAPHSNVMCGSCFLGFGAGLSSSTWNTSSVNHTSRRYAATSYQEINKACTLLGVDINTNEKDLKKKYRALVKKHHPDMEGGSEEMMKQLGVAYTTLNTLSKREKNEYSQFGRGGGGGGSYGRANPNAQGTASYQRAKGHSKFYGNDGTSYNHHTAYDYQQAYQHQRRRTYAKHGYSQSQQQDPTGEAFRQQQHNYNPFMHSTGAQNMEDLFRGARGGVGNRFMNRAQILTLLTCYFFTFMVFSAIYRRYSDWKQTEGWTAAEKLSRHEQLEELHRIRTELRDRVKRTSEMQSGYRDESSERGKELRAMEYLTQRNLQQQLRGWPAFDPALGQLMRHQADPVGIVYFEPSRNNALGDHGAYMISPTTAALPPVSGTYVGTHNPQPQQGNVPPLLNRNITQMDRPDSGPAPGPAPGVHPSKMGYQPPEGAEKPWTPPQVQSWNRGNERGAAPPSSPVPLGGHGREDDASIHRPALSWNQMTVQQQRNSMQEHDDRAISNFAESRK